MSAPSEKLEIVRLLLDTNDRKILDQVKSLLSQESNRETDYLLSEEANAEHLRRGVKQASRGEYKLVDIDNLWK